MPLPIVKVPDDFTGAFRLAFSSHLIPVIENYRDRIERIYLIKLLGKELADLFISDLNLTGNPVNARFITIFNPIYEQENGIIYESKGIKHILTSIIFWQYIHETQIGSSQSGVSKRIVEAGIVQSPENASRYGEIRYNECLMSWDTIQWFCKTFDSSTYPEFKGSSLEPKFSAIL